ncbi:hypothetical protein U6A24_02455 [Aquimarina gracilis]|uniref:Bacteriocin-like protein n=1 Tax=Aquimarina gracilis TaxID=874422 RepID=A0ABU5ZR78_9FLAO|nr:hypothetical protein [Aquimarina gracilis]MEB3344301.1 hypothetical protein [Aquimarina gracilis]
MKSILDLKGVKNLSKKEQQNIAGAAGYGCIQRGRKCCNQNPGGEFCAIGRCTGVGGNGGCLFF